MKQASPRLKKSLPANHASARNSRRARLERKTNETDIRLLLKIDGHGTYKVATGIRFFDHMLELFARHGGFDLELSCKGDLDVDQHHTVEDVGIALGEVLRARAGRQEGNPSRRLFPDADG